MKEEFLKKIKTGQLKRMSKYLGKNFTGKQSKKFIISELVEFTYSQLIEDFNNID